MIAALAGFTSVLSALMSGGLVGVIMKNRNESRRIELAEHDAERARLDAEWERVGGVAEALRADVDRQLERCKVENEKIEQEAKALRKDVQQKGDQIIDLQRTLRRVEDELMVVRRQVGEVAEGAPLPHLRTRVEDRST